MTKLLEKLTEGRVMAIIIVASLGIYFFALINPGVAAAATYAYVDANGDVRSVVANDWRTAIATAPNIHINSGVLLLRSAADQDIVGDKVPSVR